MKQYIHYYYMAMNLLLALPIGLKAQTYESAQVKKAHNLNLFNHIYNAVQDYYVDSLSADTTLNWAIQGMLQRIDPYCEFSRQENNEWRQMTTGEYAGIGCSIRQSKKHDRLVITRVYGGTPGYEAGLKAGDILLSINGQDTQGMPTEKVSTLLRGEPNTKLTLRFERPGQRKAIQQLNLYRRNIRLPLVSYYGLMSKGVGYIQVSEFANGAAKEVRNVFLQLKNRGMQSLIIDLRGNPGGLIEEAVEMLGLFVPQRSKVLYTTTTENVYQSQEKNTYLTQHAPLDTQIPIVVLVDNSSASAAELFSGALQDMDRAVIMGERTYGKGLIQTVFPLPMGSELKLTVGRYYTPSGRCIQAHDYRHRKSDGSTGTLPDSLTHVFYTRSGRPVRDGGGIKPDITLQPDTLPVLVYDLLNNDLLFDYATQYALNHKQIPPAGEFKMSDEDFNAFAAFAIQNGFKTNRHSVEIMKMLKNTAHQEGCWESISTAFQTLEDKLSNKPQEGILRMKEHIKPLLESEIVSRYYNEAGSILQQLSYDKVYAKAIELLSEPNRIQKILHP